MRDGFIKAAAATPKITVADPAANTAESLRLVREMEKKKLLIVF